MLSLNIYRIKTEIQNNTCLILTNILYIFIFLTNYNHFIYYFLINSVSFTKSTKYNLSILSILLHILHFFSFELLHQLHLP